MKTIDEKEAITNFKKNYPGKKDKDLKFTLSEEEDYELHHYPVIVKTNHQKMKLTLEFMASVTKEQQARIIKLDENQKHQTAFSKYKWYQMIINERTKVATGKHILITHNRFDL
jgi:hypothetical protein